MPEEIQGRYRRARSLCRVGYVSLYVMAGVLVAMMAVSLLALTRSARPSQTCLLVGIVRQGMSIVATALLAEFLRDFGAGRAPFEQRQSVRLALAGLLIVLKTSLDIFGPTLAGGIALSDGPVTVCVSSQPGVDPMMVGLAVFFACLALVVRYGNALKEDSDSIA